MGNLIIGTGSYLPEKAVSNQDLLKYVSLEGAYDESRGGPYPEFVKRVMGFEGRRWAEKDQKTSDLAYNAAVKALEVSGIKARDLDLITLTTANPDKKAPATAHILQKRLGVGGCSHAMDLHDACPGFVRSLHIVDSMMKGNSNYRYALIVASEKMSSIVDKRHYVTGATFGDGAGAVVLRKPDKQMNLYGLISSYAKSDGEKGEFLDIPAGGSAMPITPENATEVYEKGLHCLQMNAKATKEFAIHKLEEATRYVLRQEGLTTDDITYFLPHQASGPFIWQAAEALNIDKDRVLTNYRKYANTSQASTAILLDENRHLFKNGDLLAIASMGGGLGWGAALYRWYDFAQAPRDVLIVDDEPDTPEGLISLLTAVTKRDPGFQTKVRYSVARSGEEFVGLVKQNLAKYDIAIVDQRMKRLSGLDAIMQAKRHQPDLLCAILTGQADDRDKQDMIRYGKIATIMYKPFLDPGVTDRFSQPNYLEFKKIIQKPYLFHN